MESSMASINSALASLRAKRTELLDQAAKLEVSIATIEETFGMRNGSLHRPVTNAAEPIDQPIEVSSTYKGRTIGDAAELYLRTKGKPQKTREIANALTNGGLESKSVNLYRTLYNTLLKREKVVLKNAKWELVDWGGG